MKYELLEKKNIFFNLYQIRAVKDFGNIKAGQLGGYVENSDNLSQEGSCWLYERGYAKAYSRIVDDAQIFHAIIYGDAYISGNIELHNRCLIGGARSKVRISGNAKIYSSEILDNSSVSGNTEIHNSILRGNAKAFGDSKIYKSSVCDCGEVFGKAIIRKNSVIKCEVSGCADISETILDSTKDYIVIDGTYFKNVSFTYIFKNQYGVDNWCVRGFTDDKLIISFSSKEMLKYIADIEDKTIAAEFKNAMYICNQVKYARERNCEFRHDKLNSHIIRFN